MIRRPAFTPLLHATLAATPIAARLRTASAVVLERSARGGGATHWYLCRDADALAAIAAKLSPGAVVSFTLAEMGDPLELFYGASLGRDDDGWNAITVTLPDGDGVTRRHPH